MALYLMCILGFCQYALRLGNRREVQERHEGGYQLGRPVPVVGHPVAVAVTHILPMRGIGREAKDFVRLGTSEEVASFHQKTSLPSADSVLLKK